MIYLKTAWKMMKKNMVTNILTIVQMVVVLFITVIMISSVLLRYQYYAPFRDYFTSKGVYISYDYYANEDPVNMNLAEFIQKEEFIENVDHVEDVASCYNAMIYDTTNYDNTFFLFSYDTEILEQYQPELSEGRWLNVTDDPNRVEVVISQNNYGWHVGDVLKLGAQNFPGEVTFEAEIVGEIKNNAKVVGNLYSEYGNEDYNSFYTIYNYAIEQMPLLLFSRESLNNLQNAEDSELPYATMQGSQFGALIKFSDDTSDEEMQSAIEQLKQYGTCKVIDMGTMHDNSISYMTEQIRKLLPVILMAFLLVIISSISGSALATKKSMRTYVIYAINGLSWRRCTEINLIQTVILFGISLVAAVGSLWIANRMVSSIGILWSWWAVLAFFIIGLMYIVISMIMPLLIIGRSTPKQILTK